MVINLSEKNSLVNTWISEIRDLDVQHDRMRFRRNLERIGEIGARAGDHLRELVGIAQHEARQLKGDK